MKIVKLEAENVKRLKAVEVVPDPEDPLVLIAGRNAQGKSSVLDSIAWAIGGKRLVQGKPIRDGEDSAEVTVELGDLTVRRRWTAGGSSLAVTSKTKGKLRSPQQVLDALVGEISFDPLAFGRMKPKDRVSTLIAATGADIDLGRYELDRGEIFNERTDLNRKVRKAKAIFEKFEAVPELVLEPVDVSSLSTRLEKALENNAAVGRLEFDADRITAEIERLKDKIHELEAELSEDRAALETMEVVDVEPIRERLANADAENEKIRAEKSRRDLGRTISCDEERIEKFTQAIADLDAEKDRALAAASMPVEGLGFGIDGPYAGDVTFDGVPFEQASSAERLRISLGIAMAANPDLRVIRIEDGSLLDDENLEMIRSMAKKEDFQVWIERVGEDDEVSIVIEDGEVKVEEAEVKGVPF